MGAWSIGHHSRWIYNLHDGLLRSLGLEASQWDDVATQSAQALQRIDAPTQRT